MTNFETIRNDNRLLFEYVRGSHLYNLNNEFSDIDTGGVFACTKNELYGCYGYKAQVSDEKHDNTWYEIGELVRLLLKSNPTVMECLFIPKDKVIGEVSPLMQMLIDNRDQFITKECFNPYFGYAQSQISKCRGLNKKCVNPVLERLTPYDFIYTFHDQGSTKFHDWLRNRGLKQDYCGLVHIPNMHNTYGVYYDFGAHLENVPLRKDDQRFSDFVATLPLGTLFKQPIGYRGVISDNSTELRLSCIPDRDAKPICYIYYNQEGYSTHCRQYKEYQEWVNNRNPQRYESNLGKTYDAKNVCHAFRLMHMAMEIALGEGVILERTEDRDFLLNVRNHKYEYEEIIERLESDKETMNRLMEQSTIKEHIDKDFVNQLMIDIRKKQFG